MTNPARTGPTLSEVRAWDTEHLIAAAGHWTNTATVWEDCFTDLATHISSPGGVPWEGHAAETAQQRAHSDKMTVIALADQLHNATTIARAGEREIAEARRRVLSVVQTAEEAGFTVGDDFSVTDPHYYDRLTAAARRHRAEAIATRLRDTVATLVAADIRVAGDITAATTGLGTTVFPETEGGSAPGSIGQTLQLVNSVKQDRNPTPMPRTALGESPETAKQPWWNISKSDLITGIAGGAAGATSEYVAKKTREAIDAVPGTGAGRADAQLKNLVDEVTVLGKRIPGLTRVGGIAGAAMAVPMIIKGVGEDGNSLPEAVAREGAGLAAGALVGGIVGSGIPIPVVGTAIGVAVGGYFGAQVSKLVDKGWEPAAETVGKAVDGLKSVFG